MPSLEPRGEAAVGRGGISAPRGPWPRLAWILIAAAAGLRLWGYFTSSFGQGSLWLDELFIANNLRQLSPSELLGPLLEGQNAPVGWLLLQKAVWTFLGPGEHWLRLVSVVASIAALPVVHGLARRCLHERYALVALALVGFSPFVVWQALQLKPYSTDLAVAVGLLWLGSRVAERRGSDRARSQWILGCAGLLALVLSMPSIFVLAGVGTALGVRALREPSASKEGRWAQLPALLAMGAVWLAAFGLVYVFFLRPRSQPEWLYHYWASGFLDWPVTGWRDLLWLPRILVHAAEDPLGFAGLGLVAVLPLALGGLLGLGDLVRDPKDLGAPDPAAGARRSTCILPMVVLAVAFAVLASAFRLYPFASRLLLFAVPGLALLWARGLEWLGERGRVGRWGHSFFALVLAVPVGLSLLWLPRGGLPIAADSRQVLEILESEHHEGEPVVLEHMATYAWTHYGPQLESGIRGPVVELPSAWSLSDRVSSLERRLRNLARSQSTVWVVLTRATAERAPSLGPAFVADLGALAFSLPRTHAAFVDSQTDWPLVGSFRAAVPEGWAIEQEWRVCDDLCGGYLWRLGPVGGSRSGVAPGPESVPVP